MAKIKQIKSLRSTKRTTKRNKGLKIRLFSMHNFHDASRRFSFNLFRGVCSWYYLLFTIWFTQVYIFSLQKGHTTLNAALFKRQLDQYLMPAFPSFSLYAAGKYDLRFPSHDLPVESDKIWFSFWTWYLKVIQSFGMVSWIWFKWTYWKHMLVKCYPTICSDRCHCWNRVLSMKL